MRILQEGEHGTALAPELGRVPVVYRYRDLTLDSGTEVRSVLVGVHEESGDILVIPAQSTPRIKEAREAAKEEGRDHRCQAGRSRQASNEEIPAVGGSGGRRVRPPSSCRR